MNNNNMVNNLSLVLQMLSLEILFKDYNNSDLMNELQKQDKEYLEKIIKQNDLIIELLQGGMNNGRKSNKKS